MDNIEKIKAILRGIARPDADLDASADAINALYINEEQKGGIYGVHIKNATFLSCSTSKQANLSLVKFGRTDDYAQRFRQFNFNYDVLFQVNADNNTEQWLKCNLPSNAKKALWPDASVATVKQYLGFARSNNPGPTEWRIISDDLLEQIKTLEITNLNYRSKFETMLADMDALEIATGDLELRWGSTYQRKNVAPIVYW